MEFWMTVENPLEVEQKLYDFRKSQDFEWVNGATKGSSERNWKKFHK